MTVDPSYERWQTPVADDPGASAWREGHRFHLAAAVGEPVDGGPAKGAAVELIVQIERLDASRRLEFRTALFEPGKPIVGIVETRITAPSHGWEFRASGIWADHICEDPMVHWSYGLEAFAIAVDNADELTESGYGDRVPLGWELEFEAESDASWLLPVIAVADGHYLQSGRGHGLLLNADGDREVTGVATRHHWWGSDPRTGPQPFDLAVAAAAEANQ